MKTIAFLLLFFPIVAFSDEYLKMYVGKEYREAERIFVKKDDVLIVLLETYLSTGYDWKIKKPLPEGVKILEDFILYKEQKKEMEGGGEFHLFKLKVSKNCTITFQYRRKWEKEPLETKKLIISVK